MVYPGVEEDSRFILAAADELKQYLDSAVVLWPLHGVKSPLTPGNLLLAQYRIEGEPTPHVVKALAAINSMVTSHGAQWEQRIRSEIPIRLNQYAAMVEDIIEYGSIDAGYSRNIEVRVKIDFLLSSVDSVETHFLEKLSELDALLETKLNDGDFIWDESLQMKFPMDKFHYLYVSGK